MYGATLSIFIASCKTFHSKFHLYEKVMLPLLLVITLKFGKTSRLVAHGTFAISKQMVPQNFK